MYLILSLSMRQYATSKITSSTLYTIRSKGLAKNELQSGSSLVKGK